MNNHYYLLDTIRFFCALYVFAYHLLFRSVAMAEYNSGLYGPINAVAHGWIGVQIFFVISGFLIYKSALSKNITEFLIGRALRLYPAYWACILVTVTVMLLLKPMWWDLTAYEVLINLTMFQGFIRIANVDGVYWTLMLELIFYFWVAIFVILKKIQYLKYFLLASTLIYFLEYIFDPLLPSMINKAFLIKYASYFLIGIILCDIKRSGWGLINILILLISVCSSCIEIMSKTQNISLKSGVELNGIIPVIIFFVAVALIYYSSLLFAPRRSIGEVASKLGLMSYPLYLLHQNISYSLVGYFGGGLVTMVFIIITVLLVSYLISVSIEPIIRSKFDFFLTRLLDSVRFKYEN